MLNLNNYKDEFQKLDISEEDAAIILAYFDAITDMAIEHYNEIKRK